MCKTLSDYVQMIQGEPSLELTEWDIITLVYQTRYLFNLFNPYWQILGHELDRFTENSSNRQFENFGAWQIWTSLPEICLAHALIIYKNWKGTHKKLTDEFSRNRSSSCPGNWNFERKLDEFSRNWSVSHPGKLKFQKNSENRS